MNAACEQTDRGEAAGKPSSSRETEGGKEKGRERTEADNKEKRREDRGCVCAPACIGGHRVVACECVGSWDER